MTHRLLITARDVAASLHLIEIARAAAGRSDFSIVIATQKPATHYFRKAGFDTLEIDLPPARSSSDPEGRALMQAAAALINQAMPASVLCGLSTPFDAGLDEAVTAVFEGPRFVMQDFWGEANLLFGRAADLYFALDEEGVRLSRDRHQIRAIAIGSPRHAAYRKLESQDIRRAVRSSLGIAPDEIVMGFFGQALHGIDGYRKSLEAWARAAATLPCVIFYRPHPRECEDDIKWSRRRLSEFGRRCVMADSEDVEHSLLACDVVCSAFSNCTYDVAYLNYFSPVPLITPMALFFDAGIIDYFHRMVRLAEFPYLKAGLVLPVRDVRELAGALTTAASPRMKAEMWTNARSLADPAASPNKVLDAILGWPHATANG